MWGCQSWRHRGRWVAWPSYLASILRRNAHHITPNLPLLPLSLRFSPLLQDAGFITAVETLQMRLDTLPQEDWGSAQEEAAAATQLAAALHRDLPPQSAEEEEAAAAALAAAAAAVVDDSSTSGAPPAALQLMALPAAPTEPAN